MTKSVHQNVTAADVHNVTLENISDSLTVEYNIDPDNNGRHVTTSKVIPFSSRTPPRLAAAAKEFVAAVVEAIRSELDYKEPVKCDTCTGACCRLGWDIRVTAADIERMRANHLDPEKLVELYNKDPMAWGRQIKDEWTGFCGTLRTKPMVNPVTKETQQACVSLDNKTGRCTVYDGRPKVCRDFDWVDCDKHEAYPKKPKHSLPVLRK